MQVLNNLSFAAALVEQGVLTCEDTGDAKHVKTLDMLDDLLEACETAPEVRQPVALASHSWR